MEFGDRRRFAIECELTSTDVPYFFGRFRIWIAGRPHGDFSGEIISTYVIALSGIAARYRDQEIHCSGLLPYMEALEWRVAGDDRSDRIEATVDGEPSIEVLLAPGEFRSICDEFCRWVRAHPGFTAA